MNAGGDSLYWYTLVLENIHIPAVNFSKSYAEDLCKGTNLGNCIADTGNSYLYLPLSDVTYGNIAAAVQGLNGDELANSMLSIDLSGINGTVTLDFPLTFIVEQVEAGYVMCTGDAGSFTLGMPTFQYYYLMNDMDSATVTFVDLQGQGNVTSNTNTTSDTVVGPEPVSTPESNPTVSPSAAKQLTTNATAMMAALCGALYFLFC